MPCRSLCHDFLNDFDMSQTCVDMNAGTGIFVAIAVAFVVASWLQSKYTARQLLKMKCRTQTPAGQIDDSNVHGVYKIFFLGGPSDTDICVCLLVAFASNVDTGFIFSYCFIFWPAGGNGPRPFRFEKVISRLKLAQRVQLVALYHMVSLQSQSSSRCWSNHLTYHRAVCVSHGQRANPMPIVRYCA